MLKRTTTVRESLHKESKMEYLQMPLSSVISEHSLVRDVVNFIKELQMSSLQDFPANHSALLENEQVEMTHEICGQKPLNVFAEYDPNMHFLRMCRVFFQPNTFGISFPTWPKQGIMQDGACWAQMIVMHIIEEKDYLSLPTPTVADQRGQRRRQTDFQDMRDWWRKNVGGLINPCFMESIMGYPIGWTDLKPLEMDRFHRWLQQHGEY